MRARTSLRKSGQTPDPNQVHRLTDILVEEVSLVDKAANKRSFIVVKADAATPPAASETAAPPAEPAAPAEPVMKLSPENKAAIVARCKAALARITALMSTVEKAEEVQGLPDIPQPIIDDVNLLVDELTTGAGETTKSDAPALVLKAGRKQISRAREAKLRAASGALRDAGTALDDILKELEEQPAPADDSTAGDAVEATKTAEPEATPSPAPTVPAEPAEAPVAKNDGALLAFLDRITKAMEAQSETIRKQAQRLTALESERPVSNAPGYDGPAPEPVTKSGPVWKPDMSESDGPAVQF